MFEWLKRYLGNPYKNKEERIIEKNNENRLYVCIVILAMISVIAFNIEALKLGFIPFLLRGVPHAYSYFHISGVHYFTVSCILVPSLSIIYLSEERNLNIVKSVFLVLANIVAMLIPILCVSRFQFMFAILMAFVTLLILKREKIRPLYFIAVVVIIVPVSAFVGSQKS